jgi:diguanylate cyclase (GGDEF)-like protein
VNRATAGRAAAGRGVASTVASPGRGRLFLAYVVAVEVVAVAAVVALAHRPNPEQAAGAAFWVIAVLAVLVEARPFAVPGRGQVSRLIPSICFTFALLLGWGLLAAAVTQSLAVVVSSVRLRLPPWRALFNACEYALSFAAAAFVLDLGGQPSLLAEARIGLLGVMALGAAVIVWFVVNQVLVTTAVWLRFGGGWLRTMSASFVDDVFASVPLLAMSPLVVAVADVNAALVPLMLIPLYSGNEMARYVREEQRRSQRDELTGLPNRKALFAEMSVAARGHRRRGEPGVQPRRMALLLLDIDQFRQVNNALGHVAGDRLLGAIADRLTHSVGRDVMVSRLGGDEFAIFAPRLANGEAAGGLARQVGDAFGDPVRLEGLSLEVTAAIGVAVYPEHGRDNTTLLRNAEIAMYDAKDRSAPYSLYTPESDRDTTERLQLLADLRRALDTPRRAEIALHYQPQVDLMSGDVVGVEALLRWQHPRRGLISPEFLIKIVEHTTVMHMLTYRVLEDAIEQLAAWRAHGLELRASVNVSVRDLHRPELVDRIAGMLAEHGVPANQLQLEITEGALMSDPRRVMVTLHRLETLGVALSLDDFGVGYSSLQHLRRLPLAEVKIDRSFVLGMANDPDDAAVVRSIVDLARALGLRVVAEGVEEDTTRRMLIDEGCEVGQGWYFARPMPADHLVAWLARYLPVTGRPGPASSPRPPR